MTCEGPQAPTATASRAISVIIPALDEEAMLPRAVGSIRHEAEVIVVDGGSWDGTCAVAEASGAVLLASAPSRGLQLDAGARAAMGEWLVFLHADTWLEAGWAAALRGLLPDVVGGAFRFTVDSARVGYRLLEAGVALRCRLWRLPYGDQGLFVRRSVYQRIGGFPPLALMEDVAFVRRLSRADRLAFPSVRAITSPRRWEGRGIIATTMRNWWLLGLYACHSCGASMSSTTSTSTSTPLRPFVSTSASSSSLPAIAFS